MCGIVGSINLEFGQDFLSSLSHRGPDDSGVFEKKNIILGHRRLSILDPTSSGHQPMSTQEENYVIVYNGEIYNHLEIRDELKAKGYNFNSSSDTETLLKGWDCWGKKVIDRLNGIFAFSILDKTENKLFIVRDHYGIKPVYLYEKGNSLAFSSELKVFEHLNEFDDTIAPTAFTEYLSFLWAPGERTPYKYIRKLLPGYYVEIPLSKPQEKTEVQYYQLPFEGNYLNHDSEKELVDQLDYCLQEAVDGQLLSDVPLGFFLSGGLDSSLLVGIARHLYPDRQFDCFTIDSNMDKADEGFEDDLPYARKVAEHLNVDLHEIPADHKIADQFDHMIWHLDEPQADPAPINVYNISRGARERGIKVLLGGTAGDDLFSGYRRHQALRYDQYIDNVPVLIRRILKKGFSKLSSSKPLFRRLQKLSRDWEKPFEKRMLGYFNWFPDDGYVFSLFQDKTLNKKSSSELIYSYFNEILNEQDSSLSSLDRLLYLEMKTFLVDHNLNYTDKMSMAAGVEARVPYLDKELVKFAGKIPMEYKLRGGETKYLLKKVAERYLPKDVIYRSKTGFGAPIRDWLKNDLKPMVNERLSEEHLAQQGIFDPDTVQEMIEKNTSGEFDFSYNIWSMLAIQSWLKQFKWSL